MTLNRLITISALATNLFACGSLTGLREIAYVESVPPGMTIVKTGEIDINVRAPALVPIRKASSASFTFKGPDNKTIQQIVPCNIRWLGAVTADAVGAALIPNHLGAAAFFFGTDALTGGIYTCPDYVTLKAPAQVKAQAKECLRFLVIPSAHLSPEAILSWQRAAAVKETCHRFIFHSALQTDLQYYGLVEKDEIDVELLSQEKWRELAYKHHANALIFLNVDKKMITTTSYNLGHFKPSALNTFNIPFDEKLADHSTLASTKKFLFYLFPNSISVSSSADMTNVFDDPNIKEKKRRSILSLSDSFGFQTVPHPDSQNDWSLLATLAPSLSIISHDVSYKYKTPTETTSHTQMLGILMPGYRLGLDFFTPIGTYYLSTVRGPALIYVNDDGKTKTPINMFWGYSIGVRGFALRNLFSFFQYDYTKIDGGPYGSGPLEINTQRIIFKAGFGLYLPLKAMISI